MVNSGHQMLAPTPQGPQLLLDKGVHLFSDFSKVFWKDRISCHVWSLKPVPLARVQLMFCQRLPYIPGPRKFLLRFFCLFQPPSTHAGR